MKSSSYKDLQVWKVAIDFVEAIYQLTQIFPEQEKFSLTSQIRRAAVSIPSDIAEGAGRRSRKEFLQYIYIARGSLMEVETQLTIAVRLHFVPREKALPIWELSQRIGQMLTRLAQSLRRRATPSAPDSPFND